MLEEDQYEVGIVEVPEYEAVAEFTPPKDDQPYGGVVEFPLRAKEQRWGHELLWAHTAAYTGKILFRKGDPSYKGRIQYHRLGKDETFYLLSGRCILRFYDEDGALAELEIESGRSFHIPAYARHSIIALEDSIFFEVSTAVFEDRTADNVHGIEQEENWHGDGQD